MEVAWLLQKQLRMPQFRYTLQCTCKHLRPHPMPNLVSCPICWNPAASSVPNSPLESPCGAAIWREAR